jgi:micrococcal nuclease
MPHQYRCAFRILLTTFMPQPGMGKIVRFDTAQAIKDAAARAEGRNRGALARLDKRSAEMTAAYESRQRAERTQSRRTVRPLRKPHKRTMSWNPSGTTIFNIGMTAFAIFWLVPEYLGYEAQPVSLISSAAVADDTESGSFGFCHSGGGYNCVVDGDTIWYQGNNIRIADIDTPETHPPGCAREAELGEAATNKLHSLLNAGAFSIVGIDRDIDPYGRQLRILTRGGASIGGMLVDNGLARWYEGGRRPWC